MSTDKPFRRINELVAALAAADKGLTSGALGADGLEAACDDARELYERLIVLRHKAREAQVGGQAVEAPPTKAPQNTMREPALPTVPEERSVRLDTRPPAEPAARQTSLIDAIEHTEKQEPAKAPAAHGAPEAAAKMAPSVAEKLEKAAVADLGKAISLSHKFWFVAELFNGDRISYEKSIEQLNAFNDLAEANAFIAAEVVGKLKKPADPEALATFNELVERRYA
ncbi:MAG: hypothetical protein JNM62_15405 [Flavobacteriales bacterium]|nr:hypothetical protein [Flavobacteriales bacterium]